MDRDPVLEEATDSAFPVEGSSGQGHGQWLEVCDDNDSSRPSSRGSSGGRRSPTPDMENVVLEELPLEKLYEYFALQTHDLPAVVRAFAALKTKLELGKELQGVELYRELKKKLSTQKTWKARDVFQLLDKRANQQEYLQQTAAKGVKVLIVGGGPVGLRLAIDCLLLGCDVKLIEKRRTFSRNNVLHLWPFTIEDLRQLGAKKFHGMFCAGAIDHISIRSLQCILLKISLLLGLSLHVGLEFKEVLEPTEDRGWHAKLNPSDHFLNEFDFDILVGADGRRSTVPGFDRKELRGKLALAITANFVNHYTRDEAAVDEISGVAFIFNQKFFKELKADTGIDLENIVYYKDDTHYFVMTAKKESLLKKNVLLADYPDTRKLLHPSNINKEELYDYAVEAAGWSTELPLLDFAVNHYNEPDVALFDFTSIFQAEYAARAVRRKGKDLILSVVGDALLEPFWPIGTGLARGFLSAMDTAWMIRGLGQGRKMLDLLCEREIIAQRLPQTTPERLQSSTKAYTISPMTRYRNLHLRKLSSTTVNHLYDTDTVVISPTLQQGSIKIKSQSTSSVPVAGRGRNEGASADKENEAPADGMLTVPLVVSPSRKPLAEGSINLAYYSEPDNKMSLANPAVLLKWAKNHVERYGIRVNDLSGSWSDGIAMCALIHRFHPELIPTFHNLSPANAIDNNRLAFTVAEENFNITPLLQPTEMEKPDKITLFTYLSLFYELFADAEPVEEMLEGGKADKAPAAILQITPTKRKATMLLGTTPQSVERSWNTKTVKRRSMSPPPVATTLSNRDPDDQLAAGPPKKKPYSQPKAVKRTGNPNPKFGSTSTSSDFCHFCTKRVYLMERMSANGLFFHRTCFRCSHCNCQLKIGGYSLSKGVGVEKGKFFCNAHYRQLFLSNPEAINYSRAGAGAGRQKDRVEEEPMEAERVGRAVEEEAEEEEEEEVFQPVSRLKKLVEVNEDVMEEEQGEVEKQGEREMEFEMSGSPVVISLVPPAEGQGVGEVAAVVNIASGGEGEKRERGKSKIGRERGVSAAGQGVKVGRSVEREMEQSTMQVQTSRQGSVTFGPRLRGASNVQQLKANYEQSSRDRDQTINISDRDSLVRSSRLMNRNRYRSRGGQKSITRPMIGTSQLEHTDVMIQERRKQQQRFREAQSIQREMSQLERQNEEMEEFGGQIEQALRDAEGTLQEDRFMQSWLQLVNERNGLVRKITELSLRVKELELEDRQYQVDKELNELFTIPEEEQTEDQKERFEDLFQQKLALVEERDELVIQIDEERKREQEEDFVTNNMLEEIRRDSAGSKGSSSSESSPGIKRVSSVPNVRYHRQHEELVEEETEFNAEAEHVESVLRRDNVKRKSRIKTWLGFSK